MTVQLATVEDLPAMVELAAQEHAMSLWASMPFDAQACEQTMRGFIDGHGKTALFNGSGYLLGLVQSAGFSGARVALEYAWYAKEGGMALLQEFEEWAQRMGAYAVVVHDMSGQYRLGAVLQRRKGYDLLGASLRKMLED